MFRKRTQNKSFVWKKTEKLVIPANSQEVSNCKLTNDELPIDTNAIKELLPNFECKTDLRLTSALAVWTQTANCRYVFEILSVQSTVITVPNEHWWQTLPFCHHNKFISYNLFIRV